MTADDPPTTRDAHDSATTAWTAGTKLDPAQVRTRMKDGGVEWALVPPDLRDALRLPWLLDLYLRLAGSDPGWRPKREYELFERAWQGEFQAVERAPLERAALMLLPRTQAQAQLQDSPPSHGLDAAGGPVVAALQVGYPWDAETLDRAGVTGADRARWAAKGWLTQTPAGRWETPHGRLLNWLVASALVDRWSADRNADALIQPVAARFHDADASSAECFGNVAMDVLWLLCAETGDGQPEAAGRIIAALEDQASWGRSEGLYEHLLPTPGSRAIPAMRERLRDATGDQAYLLPGMAAKAVVTVAQHEPEAAQAAAEALRDREGPVQDWAIAVLRRFPRPELLPRLWSLFVVRRLEFRREPDTERSGRQDAAFTALKACVRRDAQWLERQFRATADADQFADLCRLLADLDSTMAHPIWREIRERALHVLASQPPRLVEVMATARAAADVDYLGRCCRSEDDYLAAAAATAMARVAPERALDWLDEMPPRELVRLGEDWLAELGAQDAQRQVAQIVVEFQHASEQRRWSLLDALFDLAPDDLLICSGDPLGLRSLWERATPAQRESARERLRKLPKQIDDAAKTTDQTMQDWFNWDEALHPFVFVCYSRDDQRWKGRLLDRLVPLEREGRLEAWHDRDIEPGGLWRQAIEESIKKATVGILLVSPGFSKSRFIQEIELPRLLARATTESLALLPVLVERAFPEQPTTGPRGTTTCSARCSGSAATGRSANCRMTSKRGQSRPSATS